MMRDAQNQPTSRRSSSFFRSEKATLVGQRPRPLGT